MSTRHKGRCSFPLKSECGLRVGLARGLLLVSRRSIEGACATLHSMAHDSTHGHRRTRPSARTAVGSTPASFILVEQHTCSGTWAALTCTTDCVCVTICMALGGLELSSVRRVGAGRVCYRGCLRASVALQPGFFLESGRLIFGDRPHPEEPWPWYCGSAAV